MKPTEQQLENQKKWLEALRSGNYTQTESCLRDSQGYCCLGVAADIFDMLDGPGPEVMTYHFKIKPTQRLSTATEYPDHVWFGGQFGVPCASDEYSSPASEFLENAAELNDSAGMSFREIAETLERWFACVAEGNYQPWETPDYE